MGLDIVKGEEEGAEEFAKHEWETVGGRICYRVKVNQSLPKVAGRRFHVAGPVSKVTTHLQPDTCNVEPPCSSNTERICLSGRTKFHQPVYIIANRKNEQRSRGAEHRTCDAMMSIPASITILNVH